MTPQFVELVECCHPRGEILGDGARAVLLSHGCLVGVWHPVASTEGVNLGRESYPRARESRNRRVGVSRRLSGVQHRTLEAGAGPPPVRLAGVEQVGDETAGADRPRHASEVTAAVVDGTGHVQQGCAALAFELTPVPPRLAQPGEVRQLLASDVEISLSTVRRASRVTRLELLEHLH